MPIFHHTTAEVIDAIRQSGELRVAEAGDEHEALRNLRAWDSALEHYQISYIYRVFMIGADGSWAIWVRTHSV